ncbi:MAG: hypothetical protein KatS3mg102_2380 [Planctomycetota bacterium]|nr:MAG: hypothetical protein KatS3mg102_2380 [Planctomycetota bacterium]
MSTAEPAPCPPQSAREARTASACGPLLLAGLALPSLLLAVACARPVAAQAGRASKEEPAPAEAEAPRREPPAAGAATPGASAVRERSGAAQAAAPAGAPGEQPPRAEGEQDRGRRDEGLLPFLPEWFPLGPPWDQAVEATLRRPPPLPRPETMPGAAAPGALPSPEARIPKAEETALTFVPIPIVYADPNLGFGGGLMPVLIMHPAGRIEWIFAPSFDYNEILGFSATSRVLYYPTVHEELNVFNDISTSGAFEHEVTFHGRDRFYPRSDFHAGGFWIEDPTRRFFGIGPRTEEDDESDYTMREASVFADVGYRLLDPLRVAATLRYRHARRIRGGAIDDVEDTTEAFPAVAGVRTGSTNVLAVGGRLTLDLRDDPAIPSTGLLVDVLLEGADRHLVSDAGFLRWRVQIVGHLPLIGDDWIASFRFDYHEVDADPDLPFWERPTLGGRDRLRGFGVGRFTDDGYLLLTAEQRVRVFETVLRANRLRLELAGFLDAGRVFGEGGGLSDRDWSFVPGVGARILIPDSGIVARGDVGFGGEGTAVFLVLGYPF